MTNANHKHQTSLYQRVLEISHHRDYAELLGMELGKMFGPELRHSVESELISELLFLLAVGIAATEGEAACKFICEGLDKVVANLNNSEGHSND